MAFLSLHLLTSVPTYGIIVVGKECTYSIPAVGSVVVGALETLGDVVVGAAKPPTQ